MSGRPSATFYNESQASAQFAIEQALLVKVYSSLYAAGIRPYAPENYLVTEEGKLSNDTALMNKLTWVPGAYEFMNLTPDQMSQLVPQVRIYKQLYNKDGSLGEEIEFVIPSKTSTDILLSDTTDQGLGIKNFQYKYVGSNPATVRNDIEAKLTLYFQNFSELVRDRYTPDGQTKYSFLDLFERSRKILANLPEPAGSTSTAQRQFAQYATREATDQERVAGIDRVTTNEAAEYINLISGIETAPERNEYLGPIEFEIKVVVGWAPPPGNTTLSYEQKEAIKGCSQAFFLTLIDHDFSFGQDGTFSLELNYRARLGAILDSPQLDILSLDRKIDTDSDASRAWLDSSGLSKIFDGTPSQVVAQLKADLKAAKYSCDHEAVKFIRDRLNRFFDEVRGDSFSLISQYLIGNKRMYSEFFSAITLNSWANTPNAVDETGRDPYSKNRDTSGSLFANAPPKEEIETQTVEYIDYSGQQPGEGFFEGVISSVSSYIGYSPSEDEGADALLERWEEVTKLPQKLTGRDVGSNTPVPGKSVPYFLFGDLLDFVIGNSKAPSSDPASDGILQSDLQKIKVLLGNCSFSDGNYSIANVPISWLSFRNFWYKKVIKPRRDTYPLQQFINDVVRDLLIGTLNSVYYNGGKRRFNYAFKTAFLSIPQTPGITDNQGNPIGPLETASYLQGYPGYRLNLDLFVIDNQEKIELRHDVKSENVYHYMFIFIEGTEKTKFRRSSMEEAGYTSRRAYNKEVLNIHHFGFGEDRGILKEANFSKTDQPYLRESRYFEKGGDPFVQLSNVYNASIKAFGAPFFYPGQYIWITPYGLSKSRNSSYRLGSPDAGPTEEGSHVGRSIANLMGLGGYHIIISVEGIIEDGLYEINIEARHDNSGANLGERVGVLGRVRRCEDDD